MKNRTERNKPNKPTARVKANIAKKNAATAKKTETASRKKIPAAKATKAKKSETRK